MPDPRPMLNVGRWIELAAECSALCAGGYCGSACNCRERQMCAPDAQLGCAVDRLHFDTQATQPHQEPNRNRQEQNVRQPSAQTWRTHMHLGGEQRSDRNGYRPPPERNPQTLGIHLGGRAVACGGRGSWLFGHGLRLVKPRQRVVSDHVSGLPPVALVRLDPDIAIPQRAHPGDAGVDLCSTVDVTIEPGERLLVGTGIAIALPLGTVGLIHPRSGLAAKSGLSVVNTPGTIDAGYRGEIKVCLINHDLRTPIHVRRGDRIAQLLVQRVELVDFVEVESLDETSRGAGGYGSSGGHASLHDGDGSKVTTGKGA